MPKMKETYNEYMLGMPSEDLEEGYRIHLDMERERIRGVRLAKGVVILMMACAYAICVAITYIIVG